MPKSKRNKFGKSFLLGRFLHTFFYLRKYLFLISIRYLFFFKEYQFDGSQSDFNTVDNDKLFVCSFSLKDGQQGCRDEERIG